MAVAISMILLLFSLLLSFSSADILSDHLTNNVDVSVQPCDDFFLHVCSQSVNASDFPFSKIQEFYKNIVANFENISNSRNLPIMNDIIKLNETVEENRPFFNRPVLENLVRTRCSSSDACYREEFDYFYRMYKFTQNEKNERLTYFASKINKTSGEDILRILPILIESTYDTLHFNYTSNNIVHFYGALTNRLFAMEKLKEDGIFEKVVNMKDDLKRFKDIIIEKFRSTPWLNQKDDIGLSFLPQFEYKIDDMAISYDLDVYDRDLELLRAMNSKLTGEYFKAKLRSTGIEVLDIFLSLEAAYSSVSENANVEEDMLMTRIGGSLKQNAYYNYGQNSVVLLAPFIYPELTDIATLNKHYNLFSVLGHEIFHSVVTTSWASRSTAFKNGMECLIEHYSRTCDVFGDASCRSGAQTFEEDGPDMEGMRINYEFLTRNYNEIELKEVVFDSDALTVTREQALFYIYGVSSCDILPKSDNHTDSHSQANVRVNALVTQMPQFSKAFACSPDQKMFAAKNVAPTITMNHWSLLKQRKNASGRTMILLLVSLLLPFASSDILSDHLTHNVNVSVNPCDDFYRHVCSQPDNVTEFPFSTIGKFYNTIKSKFANISGSRNFAIMNNIIKLNETDDVHRPIFNSTLFENLVRSRCSDSEACYSEEFKYFFTFYTRKTNKTNDRLEYLVANLNRTNSEEILKVLPLLVEAIFEAVRFNYSSLGKIDKNVRSFYGKLTNRLFVMEELKRDGIFDKIVDIREDLEHFKEVILEKFRNTPWLNDKDVLGLSMAVYYDLDENDRDLELLRAINGKFAAEYYKSKQRSTGVEILDILFSLETAYELVLETPNAEEGILVARVEDHLYENAFYDPIRNSVAILAPYLYPEPTDNVTFNKHYNIFSIIGHEIFHSVVRNNWVNRSNSFKNGMECLIDHYNRTCDVFREGSCNSGAQTFLEDGPDVEGFRINYEFFSGNYKAIELKEAVFESDALTVSREQAFFYLYASQWCDIPKTVANHTGVHSLGITRVNGGMTQMPEFSKAFSCSSGQPMFSVRDQTCNLFGPDSK